MTVPGAVGLIEQLAKDLPEGFRLGAGTVLDPETARQVILAGASFIVAPTLNLAHHRDVPPLRRGGDAGLLHADRDPDGVGGRRRRRQGVPGDGARAAVLQGHSRAAAADQA